MNKEISNKIDEIINYIKESNSYKNYLKAKELLDSRDDLKEIIANVKKYQKQLVKSYNKEIEKELNRNLDILNSDYNYIEYNRYLEEVNNLLNIFKNRINKYFEDVFN